MKVSLQKHFGNMIAFIALIISMIFNITHCNHEKSLQYKINTLTYNPKLTLTDTPKTFQIKLRIPNDFFDLPYIVVGNKIHYNSRRFKKDSTGGLILTVKTKNELDSIKQLLEKMEKGEAIPITLDKDSMFTFSINLSLNNAGNALAKILFIAITDSVTGEDLIRKNVFQLMKNSGSKMDLISGNFSEYFQEQILPQGHLEMPLEFIIQKLNIDGLLNLHIWIVYENEIGQLFDSYFWIVYKDSSPEIIPEYFTDPNFGLMGRYKIITKIKKGETKIEYKSYSEEEADLMHNFIIKKMSTK